MWTYPLSLPRSLSEYPGMVKVSIEKKYSRKYIIYFVSPFPTDYKMASVKYRPGGKKTLSDATE